MSVKNKTASQATELLTEQEYPLVYNLWVENLTINMAEGSVVNINTGRPKDPPPPGNP